jgi:hypothetical protein
MYKMPPFQGPIRLKMLMKIADPSLRSKPTIVTLDDEVTEDGSGVQNLGFEMCGKKKKEKKVYPKGVVRFLLALEVSVSNSFNLSVALEVSAIY